MSEFPSIEKCVLCDESKAKHSHQGHCADYEAVRKFIGWHPTNRFTPAVREEKCKRCSGAKSVFVYDGDMQIPCPECSPQCPPGCLPFDLPKALAGARLVTRCGFDVTDFKEYWLNDRYRYSAIINGNKTYFSEKGEHLIAYQMPLDLFLAAKEEEKCEQCRGNGFVMMPNAETEPCDKCQPEEYKLFKRMKNTPYPTGKESLQAGNTATPPPETEARRAEAENMEELCALCASQRGNHSFKLRCPLPSGESYDPVFQGPFHKTNKFTARPAPAPPRRVWINEYESTWGQAETTKDEAIKGGASSSKGVIEFIELTPEVRAKLGMGGEA